MTALAAFSEKIFPREKIRLKFLERVRTRRGKVTLPFELEYRNIFILPSVFGFAFGGLLVFMALGSLNFSNNMALLLVFVLAAVAQLTSILAYRNLVGLSFDNVSSEPVFCGEPAIFRVYIGNSEARLRLTILAGIKENQDCVDVLEQSTSIFELRQTTVSRGWLKMESFRLETRYPLGMFRAWAWLFPEARCLVYPEPARKPPPLPRAGEGPVSKTKKGEGEEVHGLRQYRQGDSPKRIAWRTSARHDDLYTREMETPSDNACELSWDELSGTELETRLSILTAWVLLADHHQLSYGLSIPGGIVPAGAGVNHRSRCLELLALYGST